MKFNKSWLVYIGAGALATGIILYIAKKKGTSMAQMIQPNRMDNFPESPEPSPRATRSGNINVTPMDTMSFYDIGADWIVDL